MTALQLLTYIVAAWLLQVLAGVAWALWRQRASASVPPPARVPEDAPAFTGAWAGWRDFRVVRREFEDAARMQCSFHLQPLDGALLAPFQPGQYLTFTLTVPEEQAGGERTITRCYSLSDRPDPTGYRVTIKRMLPQGISSNHFHDRVHVGDVLKVRAPSGHFFIDPDGAVPAVLIAGGIGITPMMSMLRWCIAEQPERAVHLYYGVRSSADHAFKKVLEELADSHPPLQLHVVYSSPGPEDVQGRDYQHTGHIDLPLLRRSLPHGRHQFYVCGPPPMMQSLVPALREWGVKEEDIHFEAFGPASARPAVSATNEALATPPTSIDVRFARSGRTLVWDGQDANLLDFAERQSVAVDSGCRSGSCGSCETKLISGTVGYADKPDYDIAKGHCLLCVGQPLSPLVLEA